MEMMRPELYLPQDRGSLPHLFAVLIFPVAFSLLCPFRFPMKIYPNNIISAMTQNTLPTTGAQEISWGGEGVLCHGFWSGYTSV